jgi:predicted cobalt transporter CbtA
MKKSLASLVVIGVLVTAPIALAAEPIEVADPAVSEVSFKAPEAQPADEEALVAGHRVAEAAEQEQAAGRMAGMDGWTTFAVGFFVICSIYALTL